MTHTFDIRFERSAGLGALLAPPENSFRWKGAGKLRIERDGISFAVKRGLLALFPLTRRVSAGQLKDVYREGDALHMTFTTAGSPQARVSCWAADASTAAEIVQLLPTRRTVEIEHATGRRSTDRHALTRLDQRVLALFIALAAASVGILMWPGHELAPSDAVPLVEAPIIPAEVSLEPPQLVLPDDFVVSIPHNSPHYAVASRQLEAFEMDAERLLSDYRIDRKLLESGAMDAETFANRLGALELQWWNVTYRMLDDGEFANIGLLDFRATMLSAARHWRGFLAGQADAIRKGDNVAIAKSFDELARAEELQSRARLYLR